MQMAHPRMHCIVMDGRPLDSVNESPVCGVIMRVIACLATVLVAGVGVAFVPAALQTSEQDAALVVVESLARLRFDRLGHPQLQSDSIKPVLAPTARPHKLLILPVRFADQGYDRFAGDPTQDQRNRDYFQDVLFAGGPAEPRARNPLPLLLAPIPWPLQRHRRHLPGGGARAALALLRPAGAELRRYLAQRRARHGARDRLPAGGPPGRARFSLVRL